MKKLLSLLAVCSFGTIASTSVVACAKKPQESEQETDPKEVIAKYNQDFEKRVKAKEFVVKAKENIKEELTQQIKDLIIIVSGENKEVKFSKFVVELKEDATFDLNYTITVEKEVKTLASKDFSIKNQIYVF